METEQQLRLGGQSFYFSRNHCGRSPPFNMPEAVKASSAHADEELKVKVKVYRSPPIASDRGCLHLGYIRFT